MKNEIITVQNPGFRAMRKFNSLRRYARLSAFAESIRAEVAPIIQARRLAEETGELRKNGVERSKGSCNNVHFYPVHLPA